MIQLTSVQSKWMTNMTWTSKINFSTFRNNFTKTPVISWNSTRILTLPSKLQNSWTCIKELIPPKYERRQIILRKIWKWSGITSTSHSATISKVNGMGKLTPGNIRLMKWYLVWCIWCWNWVVTDLLLISDADINPFGWRSWTVWYACILFVTNNLDPITITHTNWITTLWPR